jgi:hypothetical protein
MTTPGGTGLTRSTGVAPATAPSPLTGPAPAVGGPPRYVRVAAGIREQIANGTLRPGQPAPSGAALSRVTGYSTLTCRKALRLLIADGDLVPGPSRNARPRVAGARTLPAQRDLADAALGAGGALLALHDTYRALGAIRQREGQAPPAAADPRGAAGDSPMTAGPAGYQPAMPAGPVGVVIVWSDGSTTTVHPPPAARR